MEGTMENNCLPYFVEGILFLFAFSRVVFSEMPRVLGEVVCWQLVGRVSAVQGACAVHPRRQGFHHHVLADAGWPGRYIYTSSVQFSRSVVSDSLRPHESQHARPPQLTQN